MKGTMTAGEVHKQYNEIVTAFRKLIPDPALRQTFSRQVDGYMRQYALGVWQADNASAITIPGVLTSQFSCTSQS